MEGEVSAYPFAFGIAIAIVAFALLVPWLVRESRRPVHDPMVQVRLPRVRHHVHAVVLLVRSVTVSISPRRIEPTPDVTVMSWRSAFAHGAERAVVAPASRPAMNGTATSNSKGAERMPPRAWSNKRERQYEHIKKGLVAGGRSKDRAEEIAARTVNKERARAGEARTSSRSSTNDISSGRRGGLRSHRGPGGRTKQQLYSEARRKNVKGRSKMSKAQLERAVGRR
jgi:hypothetical protein